MQQINAWDNICSITGKGAKTLIHAPGQKKDRARLQSYGEGELAFISFSEDQSCGRMKDFIALSAFLSTFEKGLQLRSRNRETRPLSRQNDHRLLMVILFSFSAALLVTTSGVALAQWIKYLSLCEYRAICMCERGCY